MKLALCISGCPRKFKTTYSSTKQNILDRIDTDIFISSWGGPLSTHQGSYPDEGSSQEFIDLYNPRAVEINSYSEGDPVYEKIKDINDKANYWLHGTSMLFNMWNCNRLKNEYAIKHNVVYDFVLRYRSDLFLESGLDVSQFQELAYDRNLCFSPLITTPRDPYAIKDTVALCSNEVYDIYCDTVHNLVRLQEGGIRFDKGEYLYSQSTNVPITRYIHNESLIKNQLLTNKVKIKNLNLKFEIIR